MKLRKNSLWIYFYQVSIGEYFIYPKNLCEMFWISMWGFITYPFVFPLQLIFYLKNKRKEKFISYVFMPSYVYIVVDALIALVSIVMYNLSGKIFSLTGPSLLHILASFFIVGIFTLLMYLSIELAIWQHNRDKLKLKKKRNNVIKAYIKAKKQKICPLIEIIEDETKT